MGGFQARRVDPHASPDWPGVQSPPWGGEHRALYDRRVADWAVHAEEFIEEQVTHGKETRSCRRCMPYVVLNISNGETLRDGRLFTTFTVTQMAEMAHMNKRTVRRVVSILTRAGGPLTVEWVPPKGWRCGTVYGLSMPARAVDGTLGAAMTLRDGNGRPDRARHAPRASPSTEAAMLRARAQAAMAQDRRPEDVLTPEELELLRGHAGGVA